MYGSSSKCTHPTVRKKQQASSSEQNKQKIIRQFPEGARTLFALLGNMETVLQLVGKFGGTTIRVPRKWPPSKKTDTPQSHILRSVLTPRQMHILVQHFGGTELYIPQCTKYIMKMRNISIIKTFSKNTARGQSSKAVVQKLARRHGISDRRIWDILKSSPSDSEITNENSIHDVDVIAAIPKSTFLHDIHYYRQST